MSRDQSPPDGIDAGTPHVGRVYDYVLGGKNNYAADREYADRIVAQMPDYPVLARANRSFLSRAVEYMARAGIRQFLDLGAGIPTSPNVHEVARETHPDARVVYVDNDPVVSVHNDVLLATDALLVSIRADLGSPGTVLDHPDLLRLIDFGEPVGVLLLSVLQLFPGETPERVLGPLRERLPEGSLLAVSHPSAEGDQEAVARARAALAGGPVTVALRRHEEILPFFDGFDLVEPGLVDVTTWHPRMPSRPTSMIVLGGVARKGGAEPA
ncbi:MULTISPECIES: SAM-dependent methyltransferase [Streptosporangium]|uniref:SAM-dependent methyltransferase n=1 Tax=Streptosporangium jomthongense TaxID=1193683 RepID=A0ABV8ETW2_9ACTN